MHSQHEGTHKCVTDSGQELQDFSHYCTHNFVVKDSNNLVVNYLRLVT